MVFLAGGVVICSAAPVRSGRATVEWVTASASAAPGHPVETAIRMVLDPGWYGYWLNPGEAGMKTTVEWHLPPGWSASDPAYPVPERFISGGLAGFGYRGTVLLPVTLTPPAEFQGVANLTGKISWLSCSDQGCVPGNADIDLKITSGPPSPTAETQAIEPARLAVPKAPGNNEKPLKMSVIEKPEKLLLSIHSENLKPYDIACHEGFPMTPDLVDPSAEIRFTQQGGEWQAEVPKSEYASSPIRQFTLVLAARKSGGGEGEGSDAAPPPIELTWSAAPSPIMSPAPHAD